MNFDDSIKRILADAEIVENTIELTEQLSSDVYKQVKTVIERLGGKWNRRTGKHHFNFDPSDSINAFIETSFLPEKNQFAYFPTPKIIVNEIVEWVKIEFNAFQDFKILEPSAGQGALIDPLNELFENAKVTAVEIVL